MQTILLIPTGRSIGLTSACLGLMHALDCIGVRTGFMKPFSPNVPQDQAFSQNSRQHPTDHADAPTLARASAVIQTAFGINPPKSISRQHLERMLGHDQLDDLMEAVVEQQQSLTECDVVVCEGLVADDTVSYSQQVNAALANALDAKVILVGSTDVTDPAAPSALADKLDVFARAYGGLDSERVLGAILMRVRGAVSEVNGDDNTPSVAPGAARIMPTQAFMRAVQQLSPAFGGEQFALIGTVPFSASLSVPRTADVAEVLNASWLNEGDANTRRVLTTKLVARSVANVEGLFTRGTLLVTPGDRDDVIIASALAAMNGVPLAGLVLTGGIIPNDNVLQLCRGALKTGIPVMTVPTDSYETIQNLVQASYEIPADDRERALDVARFVAAHLDLDWIKATFSQNQQTIRLSPSAFRHQLVKKAQAAAKRIVLPEGSEPRTVEAAIICQRRGIANCVLLAPPDEVRDVASNLGLELPDGLQIMDPTPLIERYVAPMVERRKGKLDATQAQEQLKDTVVLGTMMLQLGEVDGLVSGAVHTTANTVRPAFQLIKTAPQYSLVSSVFFMLLPEQVVVYGDCAINPNPTAEQLAEIALQSAQSAKAFGIEPKVAMISYSTGASGEGEDVDKVRQATEIAQQKAPDLLIDGPLQYDAASVKSVAKSKAPNSQVAGQANVFIFPDLNTGNTTYKAVQRSANVVSVGPMLQGLNKPVNDLSRGAFVDDIVYTIALTAIQAADASA